MTVKTTKEVVDMLKGFIADGNRLALAVYGREERYVIVKELVNWLSQTKQIELIGFGDKYNELRENNKVNVYSHYSDEWYGIIDEINSKPDVVEYLVHDGYNEGGLHATLDYLAEGHAGFIADGLSIGTKDILLPTIAGKYLDNYGIHNVEDNIEKAVGQVVANAIDKVVVIYEGEVTVYDMSKRVGLTLLK